MTTATTRQSYQAIVLAGGKGTRLKSDTPKVLHDVLGKPLVVRCLDTLAELSRTSVLVDTLYLVIGHQRERVREVVESFSWPFKIIFVLQEPQLGTGHAVQQVAKVFNGSENTQVLITCGDTPCIPVSLFESCIESHNKNASALTIAGCKITEPNSYGRLVFDQEQYFEAIVEVKDATDEQKNIEWINTGIYMADWRSVTQVLDKLTTQNKQKEYYLTDVATLLKKSGKKVLVHKVSSNNAADDIVGVNSREELSRVMTILSKRKCSELMQNGVTIMQPQTVTVSPEVEVAQDTIIYPNTLLLGNVQIASHCQIGPGTTIKDNVSIGENCTVLHSYLQNSVSMGSGNHIGPYAHIRDNTSIGDQCRLGNFVEIKQTVIGDNTNAAHLSYIGDAVLGNNVNMGAGSIVANYDPIQNKKFDTQIDDNVKVGCNTTLISPVHLHQSACIAAGSTITKDVDAEDLAIARVKQTVIPKWVKRKKMVDAVEV